MKQVIISLIVVFFVTVIIPLAIVQIFNAKQNALSTEQTQSPVTDENIDGV